MIKKFLPSFLFLIFCASILTLSIRGIFGNPNSFVINDSKWKDEGPFELSPERGRFALTLSLVENGSLHFSLPIARFATPDLGYKDGHYVSLFAPGVSFVILPGYLLGEQFGLGQVGSFAVISIFALLNAFLVRSIAIKLHANSLAATLASLAFLFATPAFPYAVSLYQHHISTFLILASLYTLLTWDSIWALGIIWFMAAVSVSIDYPNLLLMIPIALYALGRIIYIRQEGKIARVRIELLGMLTFITIIAPIVFFGWFNYISYGNPLQLSGTVPTVKAIDDYGAPAAPRGVGQDKIDRFLRPETQQKGALKFFKSRNLLNGFYIHLLSSDRGVFWFTPIMFLGCLGAFFLFKRNEKFFALLLSIIGINILLYSLWGDPWGGWAFGSRYLIPAFAIMSVMLAFVLTYFRKHVLFLLLFFILLQYSLSVNTLGALTSSRNPPQVEVLELEKLSGHEEKYTYARNMDYLRNTGSKSFVYQYAFKDRISAVEYYQMIVYAIGLVCGVLIVFLFVKEEKDVRVFI